MKPSYKGFEAKKTGGNFVSMPPVGAYVAQIQDVRMDSYEGRDVVELMIEIVEGEYANRFHQVYENQKERFGDNVKYKGVFRLTAPNQQDYESSDWRVSAFEGSIWCIQQSNPSYTWDWDEKKLKGKKVGINIRRRLYTYTNKDGEQVDGETTEIGRFETIDDVKAGKCKPMRDRDQRKAHDETESTDGSEFTDVSKQVSVPW